MKLKIKISKAQKKRGIRRIYLALPNPLIKSRLVIKIIRSGLERKAEEGKQPVISPNYITRDLLKTFYKCLKHIIKEQGHFNLIEAHTSDGTTVVIRF